MDYAAILLGCPDDRGVRNNHGRGGAVDGPAAFRKQFKKLTGQISLQEHIYDIGNSDVHPEDARESHQHAIDLYSEQRHLAPTSLWIGGGHDYAYPQLKAIHSDLLPGQQLGCLNIDPHFDMRPPEPMMLSGSPFYVALEEGLVKGENMISFGVQRHANAAFLWAYAEEKEVKICRQEDLRLGHAIKSFKQQLKNLRERVDAIVLSLDLDAIQAAFAPGVSAPAMEGFTPSEILEMMLIAARDEKVVSLGIFELNPEYDIDERTARLAATCAYHFMDERLRK